eukprot:1309171-Prymnesium_polylepis.1
MSRARVTAGVAGATQCAATCARRRPARRSHRRPGSCRPPCNSTSRTLCSPSSHWRPGAGHSSA